MVLFTMFVKFNLLLYNIIYYFRLGDCMIEPYLYLYLSTLNLSLTGFCYVIYLILVIQDKNYILEWLKKASYFDAFIRMIKRILKTSFCLFILFFLFYAIPFNKYYIKEIFTIIFSVIDLYLLFKLKEYISGFFGFILKIKSPRES